MHNVEHNFETLKRLIAEFEFPEEFDLIVAVANGGIIPAAMLNQRLGLPFHLIRISLRDAQQRPMYDTPQLLEIPKFTIKGKRILLVEDRVKTGASLQKAKEILLSDGAFLVKTFAVNGKADYPLLDVPCFKFPWLF